MESTALRIKEGIKIEGKEPIWERHTHGKKIKHLPLLKEMVPPGKGKNALH